MRKTPALKGEDQEAALQLADVMSESCQEIPALPFISQH